MFKRTSNRRIGLHISVQGYKSRSSDRTSQTSKSDAYLAQASTKGVTKRQKWNESRALRLSVHFCRCVDIRKT